ncbi:hypothetical protein AN639_00100 [Candidatus Epulonipiscium fishelsonii]|uniref:Uncharacterized protein n=2 Tax=Candidatus Epulonipiscium fishelsonii TaxID=77094 RepID=A0ACC8XER1_9FIRM|nr:hypothetical protein AN396_06025 [Epulopiscium sp. SCG-B11WGA-EpuloA1]ONI41617.1 hypothetical protein AN396_03410 [Epulopiscium sp. SCG-B11WGA-EpuloA1]ONI43929.1 hypothetical protein AN639_00100 [Epulopiscium sp. SCG-B05WGA-EpuloA1]
MENFWKFISYSIKSTILMFRFEPWRMLLKSLFAFLYGVSWTLQIVLLQTFFDSAQRVSENTENISNCLVILLGMILIYCIGQILQGVDTCYSEILYIKTKKHINLRLFKKIDTMSSLSFEDIDELEKINKAINGGNFAFGASVILIDTIFFYSTYFILTSGYLYTLSPLLSVSVLAIFIPCFISNIIETKGFKNLEETSTPMRRECEYYESCIIDTRETRILGATHYFNQLYFSSLKKLNMLVLKAQLKKNLIRLIVGVITILGYGVILFMLVKLVLKQEITVGAFSAVLASISMVFTFMSDIISERIGWAAETMGTVDNYISFIFEDKKSDSKIYQDTRNIKLQDVSFKYPCSEKEVLKNINLSLTDNKTIAIVGENGSGKSTLAKILLGLYPPTRGQILVNDISMCDIDSRNYSAVFQKFCKYQMTLKENICIADISKNIDYDEVHNICNQIGITLSSDKLVNGLDTFIGREFDGIELSGGQWQRIAIARGIYREYDFIILDEPTSAIDPLEEFNLYNTFSKLCTEKTAIIITHRLGLAKIADAIIVMKEGNIVEMGTHSELISKDGEYKHLFDTQSKWYF